MSEAIKRRRGTTAEHAAFIGLEGEITVDITKKTAVVHDGVTAGGIPLARADEVGGGSAEEITYDGTASGLSAATVQGAIDEVSGKLSRPAGFLYGLTLSNNVADANNDIDIASGSCRAIGNDADIVLAAALTKRLDAPWTAGNNAGGLDTGSKAVSTGYHVWLIRRPDTGVVDAIFSTSATNPSLPANYTQKRRIGAILTDASGTIRQFIQSGGWFMLKAAINLSASWGDLGGNSPALKNSGTPVGLKMLARISIATTSTSAGYVAVTDPDLGSPVINQMAVYYQLASSLCGTRVDAWTNASGQVYAGHSGAAATTSNIFLQGWHDIRDTSV